MRRVSVMKNKKVPPIQAGMAHYQAGRFKQAAAVCADILKPSPDDLHALWLRGLCAQQLGDYKTAMSCFARGARVDPRHAAFPLHMGAVHCRQGKYAEGADYYRRALSLKPDYVEAHSGLASALLEQGKTSEAIASYRCALDLNPDRAALHYNLGVVYQRRFEPDQAESWFRQAIALQPDHAAAHNGLGVALVEQGKGEEAQAMFRQAISLAPDCAEAWYNLHGLLLDQGDTAGAVDCMEQAARSAPDNGLYRLILGMLHDLVGDAQQAQACFAAVAAQPALRHDLDAWQYLKEQGEPTLVGSGARVFELALAQARSDGLVLEFGVYRGKSIRMIAAMVDGPVHGFDSFQGIPEDWNHEARGSYSTEGFIPQVPDNVTLHAGWFEDSIPPFIAREKGPVRMMNIDCDLYSSTCTVLSQFAGQIGPGTVLVFDEYIGNASWREDEFKAFNQAAAQFGWRHEILCCSFMTRQVAIRIC